MTLQNDALRLAELDQKVEPDQLRKEVLAEYMKLRVSLRDRLLVEGVVSSENPKVREVLRQNLQR